EGEVLAVLAPLGAPAAHRQALADVARAQRPAVPVAHRRRLTRRAHVEPARSVPVALARARRTSRGSVVWVPATRSRTTALDASSSAGPTITATTAPERSACFSWARMDRAS